MNVSVPTMTMLVFGACLTVALGCSGASNSEVKRDASPTGSGSTTGTGGTTTGTGGDKAGTAGGGGASGGAAAGGTAGTGTGAGGSAAGGCPVRTSMALAQLNVLNVSWTGTTAAGGGSAKIHMWYLGKLTATGNQLSGETRLCGNVLPEFALTAAGQLVTGGSKVLIELPNTIWETPSVRTFATTGTLSGWDPGSTLAINDTVALVGLTLADPLAAWPPSYTALTPVDADGDAKPGITAVPRSGNGYVLPPTGLGLLGSAPQADRIYIASRAIIGQTGKFDSCTEISGVSTISSFDNHVVGCHIKGSDDCTASQTDFVDQSRTIYQVMSATFTAKLVPDTASCEQVRAALPIE